MSIKKISFFIIISTVIVGIAGFIYYQRNVYSKDLLRLEILGPDKVELLEEVQYVVKYKNNGNIRLEEPELIFDFPSYSLPENDLPLRIIKKPEELGGVIYPGEEKTFTFKARLMGREGELKEAKVSLSYRPKNLKASYTSTNSLNTVIEKAPLNFDLDLPSRIQSGKELKFRLNYFSNVNFPLSNLKLTAQYPAGFEFVDSSPKSIEKNEWDIGLLNKSEGGRVEISGKIKGDIGEEQVFRASIGIWIDDEFLVLKEINKGVIIIRPDLYVTQQINNNPRYVANPGDLLHYEIFFRNLGQEPLTEMFLLVNLIGPAFDFQTVQAPDGDFTLGDTSIIWDWRKVNDLRFLPAQSEAKVEFWVKLKNEWDLKSISDRNPDIRTRVFLNQAQDEFVNKVNSKLIIQQKAYYQDNIFENSGPFPPQVGQETNYTVNWEVKNYYNEIKDAKVKAILPDNVNLTGLIMPEEEADNITFDLNSREIVWSLGDLAVGQGILSQGPKVSFQISFIPKEEQQGQIAGLIGQAVISGQDKWTNELLRKAAPAIDTTLAGGQGEGEQGYEEQGIVQ